MQRILRTFDCDKISFWVVLSITCMQKTSNSTSIRMFPAVITTLWSFSIASRGIREISQCILGQAQSETQMCHKCPKRPQERKEPTWDHQNMTNMSNWILLEFSTWNNKFCGDWNLEYQNFSRMHEKESDTFDVGPKISLKYQLHSRFIWTSSQRPVSLPALNSNNNSNTRLGPYPSVSKRFGVTGTHLQFYSEKHAFFFILRQTTVVMAISR